MSASSVFRRPIDVKNSFLPSVAFHVGQIFGKCPFIRSGEIVKCAANTDLGAPFYFAMRPVKITILDPKIFLVSRSQNKAQSVNHRRFAGVVFAYQRGKTDPQRQNECLRVFAKHPEILDAQFSQKHTSSSLFWSINRPLVPYATLNTFITSSPR